MEPDRPIVKRTLLSRQPRENSLLVALSSVLIMLVVSQLCWRDSGQLYLTLAAIPSRVIESGEFWRLLTALAVHADFAHFLSNALLFGFFSYLLFGYFGFWTYPVASLLLGSLANYLSLLTYPPQVRLVGASVAVYLMAGFWLTMYLLVERSKPRSKRLLHTLGVGIVLLMPTAFERSISYRSHAVGLAIGILFAIVYFLARRDQIRSEEILETELVDSSETEGQGFIN